MLDRLAKSIIVASTKRLEGVKYAGFLNWINRLRGSNITVEYDEPLFAVDVDGRRVHVADKMQTLALQRGLAYALSRLRKDYWLDLVPLEEGDAILDCGANVGLFGLTVASRLRRFSYVGFEPSPMEFRCLERNVSGLSATLVNIALWHEDDTLDFYVKSGSADSSLLEMQDWDEKVEVRCRRLDEVAPEGRIKLMKIEAEGAEPEVLRGAEGMLHRVQWIAVDAGPERGFDQKETLPDVLNFLIPRGFELVALSHDRIVALLRRAA